MRVALYSHNIDFAGTWRSHERLAEVMQNVPGVAVDVFFSPDVENNRLSVAKGILSNCEFVPFQRSREKSGPDTGYAPITSDIEKVAAKRSLDVFHFARSGYYEWPFNRRIANIHVETNIFGYTDTSGLLDGSVVIARCLGIPESPSRTLIPNPIPAPTSSYNSIASLRHELGIDSDTLVFGRIGRPANFIPISLDAFDSFRKIKKSKYIIIGACDEARNFVIQRSMQDDVILLECTNDDAYIERFHKTIDVFAHYRSDGEICSTAIAQAMMYGIPVITHTAGHNGQIEWLGEGGLFARNAQEYLNAMLSMTLQDKYVMMSISAKKFAETHFDQRAVTHRVLEFYRRLMMLRSKT